MAEYIETIRRLVGHDLLLLPTTAIIVLDRDDRVLMQCRSDNAMWSCPGGILDIGETVRQNAVRELSEETGLTIDSLELFGVFAGPEFYYTYPNGDATAILQSVFIARGVDGEHRPDEESLELRYFPADALPSPITPTHAAFLRHLAAFLAGDLALPIVR